MPEAPHIVALVLTTRTATLELAGLEVLDRLDKARGYALRSGAGTVSEGRALRPVLTIENLVPGTGYTLDVEGFPAFDFETPAESGFLDIRDFGANPAAADNSAAITTAIDAAAPGSTVFVPQGTWRTAPLKLKSGLLLYVPDGAVLKGLEDRTHWPILSAFGNDGRQKASWEGVPADCYQSFIWIPDAQDVTIAGLGAIDAAGAEGDWWSWAKETRGGARRPRTIFANRCTNLALAGITVRNSPSWTIHPIDSSRLTFADLRVENPPDSPNTDGLNPESCIDADIVGVRFSVGDDCIAIKAGKIWPDGTIPQPTRNISVRHCLMERGHGGVVIGSEMSGSVTDVLVSRCRMIDTDRGLRIKTRRGRGGEVARIALADCEMDGVQTPLVVNAHYFCDPDGKSDAVQNRAPAPVAASTPRLGDISFKRVTAHNVHHALVYALGLAEAPLTGLEVDQVTVSYAPKAQPASPAMALGVPQMRHDGVVMENVVAPRIGRIHTVAHRKAAGPAETLQNA